MNTLKSMLAAVAVLGLISGTTLFANEAPATEEKKVEQTTEATTTEKADKKAKKSTKKDKKEDHKKAH